MGVCGEYGEPNGAMEKTGGWGDMGSFVGAQGGTRGHEGLRQTWEGVKGDPGEWGTRVTRQGGTGT